MEAMTPTRPSEEDKLPRSPHRRTLRPLEIPKTEAKTTADKDVVVIPSGFLHSRRESTRKLSVSCANLDQCSSQTAEEVAPSEPLVQEEGDEDLLDEESTLSEKIFDPIAAAVEAAALATIATAKKMSAANAAHGVQHASSLHKDLHPIDSPEPSPRAEQAFSFPSTPTNVVTTTESADRKVAKSSPSHKNVKFDTKRVTSLLREVCPNGDLRQLDFANITNQQRVILEKATIEAKEVRKGWREVEFDRMLRENRFDIRRATRTAAQVMEGTVFAEDLEDGSGLFVSRETNFLLEDKSVNRDRRRMSFLPNEETSGNIVAAAAAASSISSPSPSLICDNTPEETTPYQLQSGYQEKFFLVRESLSIKPKNRSHMSTQVLIDFLRHSSLKSYIEFCSSYDLKQITNALELVDIPASLATSSFTNNLSTSPILSKKAFQHFEEPPPVRRKHQKTSQQAQQPASLGSLLGIELHTSIQYLYIVLTGSIVLHTLEDSGQQAITENDNESENDSCSDHSSVSKSSPNLDTMTERSVFGGELIGENALQGGYGWTCKLKSAVLPSLSPASEERFGVPLVSVCRLPVVVVEQFIGRSSPDVVEFMEMYWKFVRLGVEIERFNANLTRVNRLRRRAPHLYNDSLASQQDEHFGDKAFLNRKTNRIVHNSSVPPLDLISTVRMRSYHAGATIFPANSPRNFLYIMKQGTAKYYRNVSRETAREHNIPRRIPVRVEGGELLSSDSSFLDSETLEVIEEINRKDTKYLDDHSQYLLRENDPLASFYADNPHYNTLGNYINERKHAHHRFLHHRNTLIATTRCEVCVVRIADISRCFNVFKGLIKYHIQKYPYLLQTNDEILQGFLQQCEWESQKRQWLVDIQKDRQERALRETFTHSIFNNVNDDYYQRHQSGYTHNVYASMQASHEASRSVSPSPVGSRSRSTTPVLTRESTPDPIPWDPSPPGKPSRPRSARLSPTKSAIMKTSKNVLEIPISDQPLVDTLPRKMATPITSRPVRSTSSDSNSPSSGRPLSPENPSPGRGKSPRPISPFYVRAAQETAVLIASTIPQPPEDCLPSKDRKSQKQNRKLVDPLIARALAAAEAAEKEKLPTVQPLEYIKLYSTIIENIKSRQRTTDAEFNLT